MAPLRIVALLAAAGTLGAAGRLWFAALTPETVPFAGQLEPNRVAPSEPSIVSAAPVPPLVALARHHAHRTATAPPTGGGPAPAAGAGASPASGSHSGGAPSTGRPGTTSHGSKPPSTPPPSPNPKPTPTPSP